MRAYRRLQLARGHLEEQEQLTLLREAAVVGLTTTGAAKYQSLVRQMGCRVLLMEEAAEVLEAHVTAHGQRGHHGLLWLHLKAWGCPLHS